MTKPFAREDAIARVHAGLRRSGRLARETGVLTFQDLVLDDQAHEVRRGELLLRLSPTEFRLLRFFLRHPGKAFSSASIMSNVWHYEYSGGKNVLPTYIGYLRRKLEVCGPPSIRTVRAFGYALTDCEA